MSTSVYGERIEALVEGLDAMLDHMNDDYRGWMKGDDPIKKRMCNEYHASLTYYMGKKYVKVVTNNSVCAFVVACDGDKKLMFGDILTSVEGMFWIGLLIECVGQELYSGLA